MISDELKGKIENYLGVGPLWNSVPLPLTRWFTPIGLYTLLSERYYKVINRNNLPPWRQNVQILSVANYGGSTLLNKEHQMILDFIADTGDHSSDVQVIFQKISSPIGRFSPSRVVVIGGDWVYPLPIKSYLRRRLITPVINGLDFSPNVQYYGNDYRPISQNKVLLGVPGNHDWFDGLHHFNNVLIPLLVQQMESRKNMSH